MPAWRENIGGIDANYIFQTAVMWNFQAESSAISGAFSRVAIPPPPPPSTGPGRPPFGESDVVEFSLSVGVSSSAFVSRPMVRQ